ncbi:DNA-3-methyladenine glycosylase [Kribbella orskensis]|uniref:Putative 3-methyladenine DNA glycosylase n=1 Tax=Kribbella orskensis TaxID=2512216 RepID=A0ABY2B5R5_9ACTN|nr:MULTISPECIES: DNA-3-methyladenine glycosylase [Kribbella]TCN28346.1 DNA-3-methyladenine glycosylase [Kribbella sp. VKM Ac-2500]TCO07790.1 DNA-3-methyladenine glycosylase [Kribbella orskensis]
MPVPRALLADPVLEVAPRLLGMVLRSTTDEGTVAVRLTEVEAYDGPNDPGSHAYRGETARNAVMFGPPGFLYVYFTYGMHFCMNVSAGPDGQPSAVLFRAGEIVEGHDLARKRRGQPDTAQAKFNQSASGPATLGRTGKTSEVLPGKRGITGPGTPGGVVPGKPPGRQAKADPDRDLARGPARLCVALGIDREANGADLLDPGSPMQLLEGPGFEGEPSTGPRVGLREAADRPWRFWIPGDPTVSPYRPHVPKRRS